MDGEIGELFGPGGAYEIVEEDLRGTPMSVFRNRMRSAREIFDATERHCERELLIYGEQCIGWKIEIRRITGNCPHTEGENAFTRGTDRDRGDQAAQGSLPARCGYEVWIRSVDTKDWALLASVFAPDARSVYSGGKYAFDGRDAIVEFLSSSLGNPEIQSMHHAHTPEIAITSETTAVGVWYLEDFVLSALPSDAAPHGTVMHGNGIYHDEYVKIDGEWQISLTGYERIFEDLQPRAAGSRLRSRWDSDVSGR